MRLDRTRVFKAFTEIKRSTETNHPISFLGYRESDQHLVRHDLSSKDAIHLIYAMKLEINKLYEHKTWERFPRSSLSNDSTLLQADGL